MNCAKLCLKPILEVKNLSVSFNTENGKNMAVDKVNLKLFPNTALGIVGESGCGKSVTALSIIRLLPKPSATIETGEILFSDNDILKLNPQQLCSIRGDKISVIFQEPMTALNPVHKIGKQIAEVIKLHNKNLNQTEIQKKIIRLLQKTGIPDPEKRINEYPHQISGGMRQRVIIAIALACEPSILIADEPTTALDATIQAQIIELIKKIKLKTKMSVIFISHDLGVIAEICDNVAVMYAGKIIETGNISDIFNKPAHPYTKGLINSIPGLKHKRKTILNTIKGMVPKGVADIKGCKFENRCSYAQPICKTKEPEQILIEKNHLVSCLFPLKTD